MKLCVKQPKKKVIMSYIFIHFYTQTIQRSDMVGQQQGGDEKRDSLLDLSDNFRRKSSRFVSGNQLKSGQK